MFKKIILISLMLVAVTLAATTCEATKKNNCAEAANAPFCQIDFTASANETSKLTCQQCRAWSANKDCDCSMDTICYNMKGEANYGSCQAPDLTAVGKNCDPAVTALTLKKDSNEKLFCGQYVLKDDKFTVIWSGSCIQGKCRRCNPGANGGCNDLRHCLDGGSYSTYSANVFSWAYLGANAMIFLTFFLTITVIPVALFVCFKAIKG
eukprot:TRINITY_DN1402_c0_g1_i1.p2 TRINITY_DN1402_c0_g1~~TRINITY_DN1402_c0_g1_i1.p2  ORF type:complete len:208 (-),score=43.38 TRINITY_DN1402_c0_g1_i1:85-708(-)